MAPLFAATCARAGLDKRIATAAAETVFFIFLPGLVQLHSHVHSSYLQVSQTHSQKVAVLHAARLSSNVEAYKCGF